jgi:transposase
MLEEVHTMETKRPYCTPEFRAEAVQLVRGSNKAASRVTKDIGVSESALLKWVRQGDIDEGKGLEGALTTEE